MSIISVIVPVYKVEKYIHRCVDSILNQTFTDFELILVDDGSPDNCGAICDEYAQKDGRVVAIHQENGGLSAARNAGIDWAFANSDSEWLTFIDSDDWVHPNYLERLFKAATDYGTTISMCYLQETSTTNVQYNNEFCQPVLQKPEIVYAERYESTVVAPCKLYAKELFSDVRYPMGKIVEDLYTTYKVLFQSSVISVIGEAMYYYFQTPCSIMRSPWTPWKLGALQAHEEAIDFFSKNHFEQAQKRQIQSYITALAGQWWQIKELDDADEFAYASSLLQKKLRFALIKDLFLLNYSFKKDRWIFEAAYPRLLQIYWIGVAIRRRFMRLLGKET